MNQLTTKLNTKVNPGKIVETIASKMKFHKAGLKYQVKQKCYVHLTKC